MKKFFAVMALLTIFAGASAFCEMGPGPDDARGPGKAGHEGMMMRNQGMGDREPGGEEGLMLPLKELDLTAEQKSKIEAATLEHRKARIKKEAEIKLARVDLAEILRKGNDFQAAKAKIREISAMQLDLKLSAVDVREQIYNTLTKEQKDKLGALKAERREKFKENWMEKKKKGKMEKK